MTQKEKILAVLRRDGPLTTADLVGRVQDCGDGWKVDSIRSETARQISQGLLERREGRLELTAAGLRAAAALPQLPEADNDCDAPEGNSEAEDEDEELGTLGEDADAVTTSVAARREQIAASRRATKGGELALLERVLHRLEAVEAAQASAARSLGELAIRTARLETLTAAGLDGLTREQASTWGALRGSAELLAETRGRVAELAHRLESAHTPAPTPEGPRRDYQAEAKDLLRRGLARVLEAVG